MLEISAVTARRYVMGRGGLWPGRRWRGLQGAGTAMRAMEDLQLGDRPVGRFDPKLDRTMGTLVINGSWLEDDALARDAAFADALAAGMKRFVRLLDARGVDVSAVPHAPLRKRLAAAMPRR